MTRAFKVLISCFAIFASTMTASADDQISFEPASASISGRLLVDFVMIGSGKMLKGHVLHLQTQVTITGNEDSAERRNRRTVRNIRQILLEFPNGEPSDDLAGANVEVRGKLFNKPSDAHHTKVMMIVDEISVLSESEGDDPVATFNTR